jgi:hypothetical protein
VLACFGWARGLGNVADQPQLLMAQQALVLPKSPSLHFSSGIRLKGPAFGSVL